MKTERVLLGFYTGINEWYEPPAVPELGAIIKRAGQAWIVTAIQTEGEDVIVAVLRPAPRAADSTDAQVEVVA